MRDRPSVTATKVGQALLYLSHDPKTAALLPPGASDYTDRLLRQMGRYERWTTQIVGQPWYRHLIAFAEKHINPGMGLHVGLRKRFVDDETRAAIAQGAVQVLAVGAGFDTLCLRLAAAYPEVTFVEVDHPATHAAKRPAVEAIGETRRNLHLVSADLAVTELAAVLGQVEQWRSDAKSVVVAEGLLMYLTQGAVAGFFTSLHQVTGVGSRLLFTYIHCDSKGRPWLGKGGWWTLASLRLVGEPMQWCAKSDADLAAFLGQHAFVLDAAPGYRDLRRRYMVPAGLTDRPLAEVEYVARANMLVTTSGGA